jgi:hypothetical protein
VQMIIRRICGASESEAPSSYNALFLQQFLDRMAVQRHSVMLISSICAPGSLVDSLADVVYNESKKHPQWQRTQCATLLGAPLRCGGACFWCRPG